MIKNCYKAKTSLFGVEPKYIEKSNLFNYKALIYGTKQGYSEDIMDRIASMNYYSYLALKNGVKLDYALNVTAINYKSLSVAFASPSTFSNDDIKKISMFSANQAKRFESSSSLKKALETKKEALNPEKNCLSNGIPQEQCAKATDENYEAIRTAHKLNLSPDQQMEAALMSSHQGNALLLHSSFDIAKKVTPLNSHLISHGSFKSNINIILDLDAFQLTDLIYYKLSLDDVINKHYDYHGLNCDTNINSNTKISYSEIIASSRPDMIIDSGNDSIPGSSEIGNNPFIHYVEPIDQL